MNAYLIHLTGIDDVELRLVDKSTYDYIFSAPPDFGNADCVQEVPPESMRQALWEAMGDTGQSQFDCDRWEDVTIQVSRNGWRNDRALWAYGRFCGQVPEFFSVRAAMQFISANSIAVVDEYQGVLC